MGVEVLNESVLIKPIRVSEPETLSIADILKVSTHNSRRVNVSKISPSLFDRAKLVLDAEGKSKRLEYVEFNWADPQTIRSISEKSVYYADRILSVPLVFMDITKPDWFENPVNHGHFNITNDVLHTDFEDYILRTAGYIAEQHQSQHSPLFVVTRSSVVYDIWNGSTSHS
jgi:hypothetical protein